MEKRYTMMRIARTLLKVLAWLFLVGGVLSAFSTLVAGFAVRRVLPGEYGRMLPMSGAVGDVLTSLIILMVTLLYFFSLYGFAELFDATLAIEERTREMARRLLGQ